ncbi:UDP-N-acetylmuramate dehydrogenase [bacterium]|jgi:UDP-N-acetylmuramate dehydrogenase|nr:UDP-N-acetylmuramate dehydrogenase [bacterium]MDP6756327.1 UDP-N-acetylmuramate dehydrogenase [Patescibacteria group bacterium]|tara:strand:- start:10580 stop:11599 length:1020 start_codon:yes stop_codon:yes gene_type:complete
MKIQEKTNLSEHTSIKLGGNAKHFVICSSVDEIQEALEYAKENNFKTCILAGGSNTIFPDIGFDGLVIKMDLRGVSFESDMVTAAAGENWDDLVEECVKKGLAGIEALSGIPGSVGATPIQNVGAYGQEVSDVIINVRAIDRETLKEVEFKNRECEFGYRTSRFKTKDKDKYIITEVQYQLKKDANPKIEYDQLKQKLEELFGASDADLNQVREAVLELRKGKSMLIDPKDPNTQSAGSFFTNPILSKEEFNQLQEKVDENIPSFPDGDNIKVPAAWLVEQAGFKKGHTHKGAATSENHSLALVNRGGTTSDILELAEKIQKSIKEKFNIDLEIEPNIV